MHENLNRGRRGVIAQSDLSFSRVSSLVSLAKDDPSLLPAVVSNLCNLKLGICLDRESQAIVVIQNNQRFLWAGINETILFASVKEESGVNISSVPGISLFSTVAKVNSSGNPIGLIIQYGNKKDDAWETDSLVIPSRLFKPRLDIFSNPQLEIAKPRFVVAPQARQAISDFLSAYPEIQKAYYAERIKDGKANHILVLQTKENQEISDQFLLTTPSLILEKHGFNPDNIWVVCSRLKSANSLPVQEIYSKGIKALEANGSLERV